MITLDMNVSSIVSINISQEKGSYDLPFRVITLVDKDGKEHTINVFGTFTSELTVNL